MTKPKNQLLLVFLMVTSIMCFGQRDSALFGTWELLDRNADMQNIPVLTLSDSEFSFHTGCNTCTGSSTNSWITRNDSIIILSVSCPLLSCPNVRAYPVPKGRYTMKSNGTLEISNEDFDWTFRPRRRYRWTVD